MPLDLFTKFLPFETYLKLQIKGRGLSIKDTNHLLFKSFNDSTTVENLFKKTYFGNRQVCCYMNNKCTSMELQICKDGKYVSLFNSNVNEKLRAVYVLKNQLRSSTTAKFLSKRQFSNRM